MRLERGDMWTALSTADLFCITTNATTRTDGALVMGRGIAAQAKQRFPELPGLAGDELRRAGKVGGQYGLLFAYPVTVHTPIGLFQVKYHWRDEADLALIEASAKALRDWALWFEHGLTGHGFAPDVHLNFPGIGNGRLSRETVLPLLACLPDSVTVWEQA